MNYGDFTPPAQFSPLTLILLMWTKLWAPASASKWWMGFNSAFKGLIYIIFVLFPWAWSSY
jgi:hypothetical protein